MPNLTYILCVDLVCNIEIGAVCTYIRVIAYEVSLAHLKEYGVVDWREVGMVEMRRQYCIGTCLCIICFARAHQSARGNVQLIACQIVHQPIQC